METHIEPNLTVTWTSLMCCCAKSSAATDWSDAGVVVILVHVSPSAGLPVRLGGSIRAPYGNAQFKDDRQDELEKM